MLRDDRHRSTESHDFIRIARIWIPYGGVPEEEVFIRFGLNLQRFVERLWEFVAGSRHDHDLAAELATIYPPPQGLGCLCGHIDPSSVAESTRRLPSKDKRGLMNPFNRGMLDECTI